MKKQHTVVLNVGDRQRKLKARIRIAYAINCPLKNPYGLQSRPAARWERFELLFQRCKP
jgi:hypothetical protein